MKVFRISYCCPGIRANGSYVVSEDEETIIEIIAEKHNTTKENVENLKITEVSKEQVLLKSLSVGDFLRLLK